jgi:hypothetical protein
MTGLSTREGPSGARRARQFRVVNDWGYVDSGAARDFCGLYELSTRGRDSYARRGLDGKLRLTIRHKITAGTLPGAPPKTVWAGAGNGRPCDACGEVITAAQTEIELEMSSPNLPAARLHRECFAIWKEECDHR